ncbi:MutS-related protein [Miniphocaeibacter massiliensis]|uniref:MutS-related protein n=1 Tax=Miniphocaeibacter massiliensis TaxID=2041841 RepID=UPI000C1B8EA1|nr:hypothetical protein [Miniphocaeibacter massiliensis]
MYKSLFLVILIIAGFSIALFIKNLINKKRLINLFFNEFGNSPIKKEYPIKDVSNFLKLYNEYEYNNNYIDDITWNDLDLDDLYKEVNICKSSIGGEYLYKELHNTKPDSNVFNNRQTLKNLFKNEKSLSAKVLYSFSNLGKIWYTSFADFYYGEINDNFAVKKYYNILAVSPLFLLILSILINKLFLILFLINVLINVSIYLLNLNNIEGLSEYCRYFIKIIVTYSNLKKLNNPVLNNYLDEFSENFSKFQKFKYLSGALESKYMTLEESLAKIFNMVFLTGILTIKSLLIKIKNHQEAFRKIVECIGEVELSLSIANYELTLPYICKPKVLNEEKIEFKDIYHPLVKNAIPNSLNLDKNIIITGSNASGKSTFIKAIGINLLFAQNTGTACANSFSYKPIYIISSMAIRDDVLEGNSYFMKEILSLKRILNRIENTYSICLIDEILRGTNTIERIAASSTILEKISNNNSFKLIATHDIELSELLSKNYSNFYFSESEIDGKLEFDYKIKKGSVATTNAISLLQQVGFEKDIIESSKEKVSKYLKNRKWI